MKRTIFLAAGAAAASFALASTAEARVGDRQWTACVWQNDPQAAGNWLNLEAPKWQDKFGSPAELLGFRLMAICDATPADPTKPNRLPNWRSMQQQLKRSQPKDVPASAPAQVEARLCEHYATKGDVRALYLAEVVRVEGASSTTVHQAYLDQWGTGAVTVVDRAGRTVNFQYGGLPEHGSSIRMPQDTLIASPAAGFASEKVCRVIAADGKLIDA